MLKKSLPFLIPIVLFLIITLAYNSPILSGKVLVMHDTQMAGAGAKEVNDYYAETGEWSAWTNSMFGGMPAYLVAGDYPNSLGTKIGRAFYLMLPIPVNVIFLLMVGCYILGLVLRFDKWIATVISIGFAFGTYNLLYTEAGHISKILAIAYVPVVMAGFVLVFRKRYALGTFLTALGLTLEVYSNHLQITYYLFLIVLVYSIYKAIQFIKVKDFKPLLIAGACLLVATAVGVGSHGQRLWSNYDYSKQSTRGTSELTNATAGKDGLDRDYAFSWSYGIGETGTLIIPHLMGGASTGALDTDSEVYQSLVSGGVPAQSASQVVQSLPLYHGEQTYVSGPAYAGIVLVFLFILSFFVSKSRWRWFIGGFTALFIMLAWGKHFASFNNLMFDYFPGYNKFRAVTMTLIVCQLLFAIGAGFCLNALINFKGKIEKPLMYSLGGLIAIMLAFYFGIDYNGIRDAQLKQSFGQSVGADFASNIVNSLIADRQSMAFNDVLRSIFLIVLTAGMIWAWTKGKVSSVISIVIIGLLITFDLFSVGKQYFNNDDFSSKFNAKQEFTPSIANQQILQDKDPHFRVVNLATSFVSDATDSYFHKSIGGYHGAKLKRTQEVFDQQLTIDGQINLPVLNMMNTKYFIVQGQEGQLQAQRNTAALGNAWLVDQVRTVASADEELAALGTGFNPMDEAVVQERFFATSKSYSVDSLSSISLTSYKPNELTYNFSSPSPQFAVFSEIYYKGNEDWVSTIDGEVVEHMKVNYLLRGMEIPAGQHEVKFVFKPKTVTRGRIVDLVASIGLVFVLGATVFFEYKGSKA